MRLIVTSDTHGSFTLFKKVISYAERERVDLFVHLGDLLYHGPRNPIPPFYDPKKLSELVKGMKVRRVLIKGNCDSSVDETVVGEPFPPLLLISAEGILFSLSHTEEDARKVDADVYMFGHTHIPKAEFVGGKLLLNPGSVSLPKGGSPASFAFLDTGRRRGVLVTVENLEVFQEFSW